jgi:hypothetical protein
MKGQIVANGTNPHVPIVSLQVPLSVSVSDSVCGCVCVCLCLCVGSYLSFEMRMYVCLSIHISMCLSVCVSVCLPICLSVCLQAVCQSVYLSDCLSVFLFVSLSIVLFASLSVFLFVSQSVDLFHVCQFVSQCMCHLVSLLDSSTASARASLSFVSSASLTRSFISCRIATSDECSKKIQQILDSFWLTLNISFQICRE